MDEGGKHRRPLQWQLCCLFMQTLKHRCHLQIRHHGWDGANMSTQWLESALLIECVLALQLNICQSRWLGVE